MKYIDADRLREMIAKQMESLPREVGRGAGTITPKGYGMMQAFQIMRSIIDSLQQDFPTTDEQVKEFLATHPKIEVPEKYKNPDWLFKEQKQPEVDLEKEMDKYYGMYRDKSGETYDIKDDEPCFDWKEDELSEHKMRMARHFYELGLNARKEESK